MPRLKPFGHGSSAHDQGYTLPFILGWLEDMRDTEIERMGNAHKGPRSKRIDKAEQAISLLEEIADE